MITRSNKYQELLLRQVRCAGKYILDHADEIVSTLPLKTDFSIMIDMSNGEKVPTIRISEAVIFPCPTLLSEVDEWEADE